MRRIQDMMNNIPTPGDGSQDDSATSSSDRCALCGREPLCMGLGMVRTGAPLGHPDFGRVVRCPNYRLEADSERQSLLRRYSHLEAYADKTFDSFKLTMHYLRADQRKSLLDARDVAQAFAARPQGWLLLLGVTGCGKTHLAAAVGNACLARGEQVLFLTSPDLLDHLRGAFSPDSDLSYDELFERVRNVPLLILDDFGVENQSAWALEKLYQLLNHRYVAQLATVITSNSDMERLEERLRSRLRDHRVVRRVALDAPDYRDTRSSDHDELMSRLNRFMMKMSFATFDTRTNATPDEQRNLEDAVRRARAFAEQPDSNWVVITGRYFGCGKTHLAAAIGNACLERQMQVIFVTVLDLLDYLRDTYSPDSRFTFDKRFNVLRNSELLILDDLTLENPKPWAKEKLFQLLDHRYVAELPTVITTSLKSIDLLDPRVQTRIADPRRTIYLELNVRDYLNRVHRKQR